MEVILSNSFTLDKTPQKSHLTSELFNPLEPGRERSYSFSCQNLTEATEKNEYISTEQSTKSSKSKNYKFESLKKYIPKENLFKKENLRKDLYGNIIKKRGNHKVSFKDDIKGNLLVEMTLIDTKQNSIRSKFYKSQTIMREARDKEEAVCSGLCKIF